MIDCEKNGCNPMHADDGSMSSRDSEEDARLWTTIYDRLCAEWFGPVDVVRAA